MQTEGTEWFRNAVLLAVATAASTLMRLLFRCSLFPKFLKVCTCCARDPGACPKFPSAASERREIAFSVLRSVVTWWWWRCLLMEGDDRRGSRRCDLRLSSSSQNLPQQTKIVSASRSHCIHVFAKGLEVEDLNNSHFTCTVEVIQITTTFCFEY